MIEFDAAPDHVVALRFEGTLTGDDFDRVKEEIDDRLARHRRIALVADLTAFSGPSLEALAKDFRYNLAMLGHWDRFPREAVITDSAWIRTAVAAFDPIIPQVEVKAFAPAERQAAFAWAADFNRAA